MRCPNCNNETALGKFCVYCGTPLNTTGSFLKGSAQTDKASISDFETQQVSSPEGHGYDLSSVLNANNNTEETFPPVRNPKKGKGILFAILAVLVFLGAIKIRENLDTQDVLTETKNLVFDSYGTTEFGKVAYRALKEIEWSIKKIDDRNYEVIVQGFSPDYRCLISVTLDVHLYGGEIYGEISAISDGEATFYDIETISDVLMTFYSYSK